VAERRGPTRLPLTVKPDANGPRIRLGVLWFAALVASAGLSRPAFAGVLAIAAVMAADEVIRLALLQRRIGALAAGAFPLAALAGTDGLLAAAVGVAAAVPLARLWMRRGPPPVAEIGVTIAATTAAGLATAGPVLLAHIGPSAAVTLVVLVSAYEAGDFVVGTDAGSRWEGPAAGITAVAVCAFAAWVLALPPLEGDGVILLGAVVAVLAPLGAPMASVLLGSAAQPARYVRRVDAWLLAGPGAAWAVALFHIA
jgi:hypothetical protein